VPETLIRQQISDAGGGRLEFTAYLDDRHALGSTTTADTLEALSASGAIVRVQWGKRSFAVGSGEITITETAFDDELEPIAATIQFIFEGKEPGS
jgi:hypothetical protein